MEFEKYEGLGNDFVVVDVDDPDGFPSDRARTICDRHFGVGADGVLLVGPARTPGARGRMVVINADGSRPEMCGNGLRCVALHLARLGDAAGYGAAETLELVVDTDAGPKPCSVVPGTEQAEVTIDMGPARIEGELEVEVEGRVQRLVRVSVGNPHAVLFDGPFHEETDERVREFVRRVNDAVVGGVNVELACQPSPTAIDLVVWERGVGRTLACGTGAVATCAAAIHTGRAQFDQELEVQLPGGALFIRVPRDGGAVLRGPARAVFRGSLRLS